MEELILITGVKFILPSLRGTTGVLLCPQNTEVISIPPSAQAGCLRKLQNCQTTNGSRMENSGYHGHWLETMLIRIKLRITTINQLFLINGLQVLLSRSTVKAVSC